MSAALPALSCDVCAAPALGVAASALGAVSFAYCAECVRHGCEPYGMTVGMVSTFARDLGDVAPWFQPVLFATLLRAGKTAAEFWADVAAEQAADATGEGA